VEVRDQHADNHIKLGPENETNCFKLCFLTFFCQDETKIYQLIHRSTTIAMLN